MADLCWMVVILTFLMSAEKSLAVDPERLTVFVRGIKRTYGTDGMLSLAVSIPDNLNQNPNTILRQIFADHPAQDVINTINNGEVYNVGRMVAAKKVDNNPAHAELRVVQHLTELLNRNNQNDLVLFYIYASPCRQTCIDNPRYRILQLIQPITTRRNYAFVFTKPFYNNTPANANANANRPMTDADRTYVLNRLGQVISLNNIYRCDPNCVRCSNGGNVAHNCISG